MRHLLKKSTRIAVSQVMRHINSVVTCEIKMYHLKSLQVIQSQIFFKYRIFAVVNKFSNLSCSCNDGPIQKVITQTHCVGTISN